MDAESPTDDELRERAEALADIREGLASIARGEGRPLEDVVRELRAKFGFAEPPAENRTTASGDTPPRPPSVR